MPITGTLVMYTPSGGVSRGLNMVVHIDRIPHFIDVHQIICYEGSEQVTLWLKDGRRIHTSDDSQAIKRKLWAHAHGITRADL